MKLGIFGERLLNVLEYIYNAVKYVKENVTMVVKMSNRFADCLKHFHLHSFTFFMYLLWYANKLSLFRNNENKK